MQGFSVEVQASSWAFVTTEDSSQFAVNQSDKLAVGGSIASAFLKEATR